LEAAATPLMVGGGGGIVDFGETVPESAGLGLDARYTVAAARRAEHLETVLAAQRIGPAIGR
jgi:hypothetical protein